MRYRLLVILSLIISTTGLAQPCPVQSRQMDKYFCHQVTVAGAKAFSKQQLVRLSGLRENAIVTQRQIDDAIARLERAYKDKGYVRVKVEVLPEYVAMASRERAANMAVKIDEGAVYVLRQLEFAGNKNTRDRIVRRCFLTNEGQPYSPRLLEQSLQKLNQLGLFETATKENVDVSVNDEEHFVDLVVHLKEKPSKANSRR